MVTRPTVTHKRQDLTIATRKCCSRHQRQGPLWLSWRDQNPGRCAQPGWGTWLAAAQHTKRQAQQPAGVLGGSKTSKMHHSGSVGGQRTQHTTVTRHSSGASNTCRAEVSQTPVSARQWRHRQRHRRRLCNDTVDRRHLDTYGRCMLEGRRLQMPHTRTGLHTAVNKTHAVTPKGRTSASGSRGSRYNDTAVGT